MRTKIVLVWMLTSASAVCLAVPTAAVYGVVRDAQGIGQLGATVEVLAKGSVPIASAITDLYGHYRISGVAPGRYQVRATAALYMPATRMGLQLQMGTRAIVNLTLNSLSGTAAWIPAERRTADEPNDDWKWTLRSTANRPVLRLLDDGQLVAVSSSGTDAIKTSSQARLSMLSGDGEFGGGGVHTVITVDRVLVDGADVIFRSDIAAARTPFGAGPSTELEAGYERKVGFGDTSRVVVSYQTHPELIGGGDATVAQSGLQTMRVSSAQTMHLGDTIEIEAGGSLYGLHTDGYAVAMQPFLRVGVHPSEAWTIGYRLATARDLQGFTALDSVQSGLPVAVRSGNHVQTERGTHQEVAVSRKMGGALLQASVYQDKIDRSVVMGTGVVGPAELSPASGTGGVVADTVTDSFAFLGTGYTARGVAVTFSQPLTAGMWAALQYQNGAALSAQGTAGFTLPQVQAALHPEMAQSATLAFKGQIVRSGTRLRTAYRWQPHRLLTPVGSYNAFSDQAFLSCYLRQRLRWRDHLPPGLDATIDVTNLLAQGYQPFLSADGRTLFLAQAPRTIQAGLSFTF
jgi:Carboxypeptidase regulatory-like domain